MSKSKRSERLVSTSWPLIPKAQQPELTALQIASQVVDDLSTENQLLRRKVSNDAEQIVRLKARNSELRERIRLNRAWRKIRKLIQLVPHAKESQ